MVRSILAVIIGFIVMAIATMIAFAATMAILGADRIFTPGTWNAGSTFIIITSSLSFVAALIGGAACRLIARKAIPAYVLAMIALAVGLSMGVVQLLAEAPEAPPREPGTNMNDIKDATEQGWIREPTWVTFTNPLIGAAGILLGARLIPSRKPPASQG